MKKTIKYGLIIIIFIICAGIFFSVQIFRGEIQQKQELSFAEKRERPPGRLLKNGPYGRYVNLTEQKGEFLYNFKADKLYFVKTRTKYFTTALLKKMVAEELTLSIYKNENKLFSLYKAKVKLPVGQKQITIRKPVIQFPELNIKPDKIIINKSTNRLTFFINGQKEVCDLTRTTVEDYFQKSCLLNNTGL